MLPCSSLQELHGSKVFFSTLHYGSNMEAKNSWSYCTIVTWGSKETVGASENKFFHFPTSENKFFPLSNKDIKNLGRRKSFFPLCISFFHFPTRITQLLTKLTGKYISKYCASSNIIIRTLWFPTSVSVIE